MTTAPISAPCVLVVSDNFTDAGLVKDLLSNDFSNVERSTASDRVVEDFERCMPSVLVLAFDEVEKAERYYLGLYRRSTAVHQQPHRTVILCSNDDVKRVSALCMTEQFDDYVLFWPLNHDGPRLVTTIHLALRTLAAQRAAGPPASLLAAQARQLSALEGVLNQRLAQVENHIDHTTLAMTQTGVGIHTALQGLPARLGADAAGGAKTLDQEIDKHLRAAADSMQPLKQWAHDVQQEVAPHQETLRTLGAMAARVPYVVLMVDDDEFQCKLVTRLLVNEPYQVLCANGAVTAFAMLAKTRPDLILMDLRMPDIDGIEVTRRLKSLPQYAAIPVMMLTGKSDGEAVVKSRTAGACGFIVKPTDKATLLMKLAQAIRGNAPA